MESDEEAALLGRIAVRHNFITLEQLAEVTRERGRAGKKLGVIMLEKGFIDEFALGKILALQQRHKANLDRKRKEEQDRSAPPSRGRIQTPRDWVFLPPERRSSAPPAPSKTDASSSSSRRRDAQTAPDGKPWHLAAKGRTPRSERPTAPSRPAVGGAPEEAVEPTDFRATIPSGVPAAVAEEIADDATAPDEADAALRTAVATTTEPPRRADTERRPPPSTSASSPSPGPGPPGATSAPSSPTSPSSGAPDRDPRLEPRPRDPSAHPSQGPSSRDAHPSGVQNLHAILTHAAEVGASDVLVSPGNVVNMRQFGRLVPLTDAPLAPDATERVLRAMLNPWQRGRLDEEGQVDLAYDVDRVGRFRANVYRQLRGYSGVFHHVPARIPTLGHLDLPDALAKLTNYSQGLILLTGPAGCGKTSTLAALVNILNEERRDHILTIEDPIEYVHRSQRCIVNQRQVGRHTTSFAAALRGALREDPDVICIGELRDLETISLALSAAETGHLVLATLHTSSAMGTINRVVGAYPPGQQPQVRAMMSESLRAVISQRLLPRGDGQGVVPALEILYVTKAIGAMIRENRTFQLRSALQTGKAQGMQLMDTAVAALLREGAITQETALANVEDPRSLSS
ncbi:MAG: PilT/PilU family type 4a pilus ATPase [Myxococcota bacterium]